MNIGEELDVWLRRAGLSFAVMVAGFAGGLVSLQSLQGLTRWKMATTLFTSVAVAGYGTPLLVQELGIKVPSLQYAGAFLLGLCAMRLVPLVQGAVPQIWQAFLDWATKQKTGATKNDGDAS